MKSEVSDKDVVSWPVKFTRSEVTSAKHSGTIGAGDVGNPYHSSNDAETDSGLNTPVPTAKKHNG